MTREMMMREAIAAAPRWDWFFAVLEEILPAPTPATDDWSVLFGGVVGPPACGGGG